MTECPRSYNNFAKPYRCHCRISHCHRCDCGDQQLPLLGGMFGLTLYYFRELFPTCCSPEPGTVAAFDYGMGYNWLSNLTPYVTDVEGTGGANPDPSQDAVVVLPPLGVFRFTCLGDSYVSETPGYTLTYGGMFTLTTPDGSVWNFQGFERGTIPKGRFASMVSPGGLILQVMGYTDQGQITEVRATWSEGGETASEAYEFNHAIHADGAQRVTSVVRRRLWSGGWQQAPGDELVVGDTSQVLETVYFDYYPGLIDGSSSSSSSVDYPAAHRRLEPGSGWLFSLLRSWRRTGRGTWTEVRIRSRGVLPAGRRPGRERSAHRQRRASGRLCR